MSRRAKTDPQAARAYLAAIEREAGTSASTKSYLKFKELYGKDVLSRRAFLEELQILYKKNGRWGRWELNGPQRAIETMRLRTQRARKPERYVILKARKLGVSVYWIGALLEAATRTSDVPCALVAQHDEAAKKLLRQAKGIRDKAPWQLAKRFDNTKQLHFAQPCGSTIDLASAKTEDPLRGATMRYVHITEPQLWLGDAKKRRIAIELSVAKDPDTLIGYEGTGCGRNWFYDFYFAAAEGTEENGFQAIFLSWLLDAQFDYCIPVEPEALEQIVKTLSVKEQALRRLGAVWGQIAWRRNELATTFGGDEELFTQEYPSTPEEAFMSEGRPAFNALLVDRARDACRAPVWIGDIGLKERRDEWGIDFDLLEDARGELKILEKPVHGEDYAMGVDVGTGQRMDNSCANVIAVSSGRHVAQLKNNVDEPHRFGAKVCALAEHYRKAYVLCESNTVGQGVLDSLRKLNYGRIGTRDTFDEAWKKVGTKLGWHNNEDSRERLFNAIQRYLADMAGPWPATPELCNELYPMFRNDQLKVETPKGKKDDNALSWGIALIAWEAIKSPKDRLLQSSHAPYSLEAEHWKEYEESVTEPPDSPIDDWSAPWP